MKRNVFVRLLYLLSAIIFISGCTKGRVFTVDGKLTGNAPDSVMLERLGDDGEWITVATTAPGSDGAFDFSEEAPEYPDLYRVCVNGKYVYLPVDSTETFTLRADAGDISRGFKLEGSAQAQAMSAFEAQAIRVEGLNNPDSVEAFKRSVYNRWLKDAKGNIFSYYVLTRRMGDGYFIDYTDPVYRAVATSFKTYRPDDPHTPLLAEQARKGLGEDRRRKGKQLSMEAPLTGIIDIKLPGVDGDTIALSDVAGKGKPAVLVFSGLTLEDAASVNMTLNKIYNEGKADIYEVCLDSDRFAWKRAAVNLPWAAVLDTDGMYSSAARSYNLSTLPAFFVFDKSGDLIKSTTDLSALEGML